MALVKAAAFASLLSGAVALRRHQEVQHEEYVVDKSCACKNWQEVYDTGLAKCGDGMELQSVWNDASKDEEFLCRDQPGAVNSSFFAKQDHEYCINAEMALRPNTKVLSQKGYAWCYVSPSCHELGVGKKVNSGISWKACTTKETSLSSLEPGDLFDLAQKLGKNNIMFARMAYTWAQVRGLFPKPDTVESKIQELMQKVTSKSLGLNKTVLKKDTTEHLLKYEGQIWEVYPTRAVCVEGCPI
mmetsp:Transcript_27565/g.62743  ORF Transcript_27565/g.62743 Transcript_27565/m.62743 type:complete len:243 (-) Transcript_27565:111-839(-)